METEEGPSPSPSESERAKEGQSEAHDATAAKVADELVEVTPIVTKSGRKIHKPQVTAVESQSSSGSSPTVKEDASPAAVEESVAPKEPSEEDLVALIEAQEAFVRENPETWTAGSLVWARQGGASSYWPCLNSLDPDLGISSQINSRKVHLQREYHVQFFGRIVLRGWVNSHSIMELSLIHI